MCLINLCVFSRAICRKEAKWYNMLHTSLVIYDAD